MFCVIFSVPYLVWELLLWIHEFISVTICSVCIDFLRINTPMLITNLTKMIYVNRFLHSSSRKSKYLFVCIYLVLMLQHVSLSLRKLRYIRDSTGRMSQCVVDIIPASGNLNCAHKAGTRGSYAFVYVTENKTCHICRHAQELGNRSLEHLPISHYPVYQRGIS